MIQNRKPQVNIGRSAVKIKYDRTSGQAVVLSSGRRYVSTDGPKISIGRPRFSLRFNRSTGKTSFQYSNKIGGNRLKLLVTSGDFSRYLSPNFDYLLRELSKTTDLIVWNKSADIGDILKQIGSQPDFVFINEFEETNSPSISGLSSLTIPHAVNMHDLHYNIDTRKVSLNREKIKYIFSYYRDKFYEWYPEFSQGLYWLPHHVNTEIFRDYGLEKDLDCLMIGAVHEGVYPLRYKILNHMQTLPGFVYHGHPGYRDIREDEKEEVFAGEKYAREINRAKIFLTDNSIYSYPLAKYFEVLACKTLLLAPSSNELTDLGFIPGVHFVDINEDNFTEKAEYYLTHEEERNRIARQGFEMVHSRHSTAQRAVEFVNMIKEILFNYH